MHWQRHSKQKYYQLYIYCYQGSYVSRTFKNLLPEYLWSNNCFICIKINCIFRYGHRHFTKFLVLKLLKSLNPHNPVLYIFLYIPLLHNVSKRKYIYVFFKYRFKYSEDLLANRKEETGCNQNCRGKFIILENSAYLVINKQFSVNNICDSFISVKNYRKHKTLSYMNLYHCQFLPMIHTVFW